MSEREFQAQVEELCKWLRLRYYHTHDSRRSNAGFPDLVIVGKRIIYVELKSQKGKVSPAQTEWLDDLRAAGQRVFLWRPSDLPEINDVLQALR